MSRTSRASLRRSIFAGVTIEDAAYRVLQLPAVADKTFLVTIGDRTVGGLCARDPMVGPWQVPVADVAVTLIDFDGYAGEAMAIGERTPLALIDAPASGRMAVGEAITNIAAAGIAQLADIKLSANWMAPAGHPGEDAALYDTVRAVAMELCPALGISIPVGKDSMSMRTTWREGGVDKAVTAPLSLDRVRVRAGARCAARADAAACASIAGDTTLLWIDLGAGRHRLGGSALAQVYGQLGDDCAGPRRSGAARGVLRRRCRRCIATGVLLAYHDSPTAALFATLAEMAFAARCGLDDRHRRASARRSARRCSPRSSARCCRSVRPIATASMRRLDAARPRRMRDRRARRRRPHPHPRRRRRRCSTKRGSTCIAPGRRRRMRMQRLRDNPDAVGPGIRAHSGCDDPGLAPALTFDPARTSRRRSSRPGARPAIAILREQGVNGQVEMAAAFDRAGFAAFDVHMSDIIAGRRSLAEFRGFVACGGFSYGDVLGAGEGWAKSILFNARARDEFAAFFARDDTFALGVCNGCQMMSNLRELIPGAAHWPHFVRNRSEQFEARFVLVEVQRSPSLFFRGMEGSRIPIATAHGEGYAEFRDAAQHAAAQPLGRRCASSTTAATPTERYPYNPNGSPRGHHRAHDGRRPLHDPDAASRARVSHRADVVASGRAGVRIRRGCACSATRACGSA